MSMIFKTARDCGVKTIIVFLIVAAIGTIISNVIYNWGLVEAVFYYFRDVLFLGGFFWGGVFVSLSAMIVFTWLLCVSLSLLGKSKEELKGVAKWFKYIVSLMVLCFAIWLISLCGVRAAFENMADWNAFHGAAYFVVHIPLIIFVAILLTIISMISR